MNTTSKQIPIETKIGYRTVTGEQTRLWIENEQKYRPAYPVKCVCGNPQIILSKNLGRKPDESCGCKTAEKKEKLKGLPVGYRSGRLTVTGPPETRPQSNKPGANYYYYPCRCDCDPSGERIKYYLKNSLSTKITQSCGCYQKECASQQTFKHGEAHTKLYECWQSMRKRCLSSTSVRFARYGGRGISICDQWKDDYEAFATWARNNKYKENLQLDRKDNDKNYMPDNCRFVTAQENSSNRSNTVRITAFGESKTVPEWTRDSRCSVTIMAINYRLKKGWEPEKAISEPAGDRKKKES